MNKKARQGASSSANDDLPRLPKAAEAERVIIGAVVLNPDLNRHVLSKLNPESFFNKQLSCIFARLIKMRKQGKTLDLPTLNDELDGQRELETAGGAPFVASLIDGIPERLPLDAYINEVREKAVLRRIAHVGEKIRDLGLKSSAPREAVIAASRMLADIETSLRYQELSRGGDSLAEVLDKIAAFMRRFVAMAPSQTDVAALWVLHTYTFDVADVTGYLSITSAEKQCGKTRLLEVLETLVPAPWLTGRVTAAVLVRKIEAVQPTLLLDESDTALKDDSDYSETLRAVLNLGYKRGGKTSCCVGEKANMEFRDFSVFCPKVIAGIGDLPDTVADRSFPIRLQRRAPNERVDAFYPKEIEKESADLRQAAGGSAASIFDSLRTGRPERLRELGDRQNEIAGPLLVIADVAGCDWPARLRRALVEIFTGSARREESLGIRLLRDVKSAFDQREVEQLSSTDLLEILNSDEQAPWSEFARGKPLNHRRLAGLLSKYDIKPEHFRDGSKTSRGYRRSLFDSAWTRYCPSRSQTSGTTGTSGTGSGFNDLAVPDENCVPDVSGTDDFSGTGMLLKTNDVPDVPDVPDSGERDKRGRASSA